jgi:ferredoxin
MVAGGHNFRRQREQRYRHRFYRKGKYLPERCGFVGCVGCGRCVGACVPKIASPVELYNSLLED